MHVLVCDSGAMSSFVLRKPKWWTTHPECRPLLPALLVAGVLAPLIASGLYVAQVGAWIAAADAAGVETTDWGFAGLGVFYFWAGTAVNAIAVLVGVCAAPYAVARWIAVLTICAVDVALMWVSLALRGHWDLAHVATAALGVLALLAGVGWLLRAWWKAEAGPMLTVAKRSK